MSGEVLKKILVIEQQSDVRSLFIEGLRAGGFYPISAASGRVGLQQAREHLPDLITCGITVPELDGYSVLLQLRQYPATAIIPFIFVAAKMTQLDLRKAMELGANDYLTKPCTVDELIRAIAVQLEKQSLLRQAKPKQFSSSFAQARSNAPENFPPIDQFDYPSEPPLNEVFQFIEANYHRSIALSDVAQMVGYSPAYLTNLVGRQTGQTVQQWIIEYRMAAARSLLLKTDRAIEQIATQVGYHHSVHFFRQFRQCHGTTPQAWRNANRSAFTQCHKR